MWFETDKSMRSLNSPKSQTGSDLASLGGVPNAILVKGEHLFPSMSSFAIFACLFREVMNIECSEPHSMAALVGWPHILQHSTSYHPLKRNGVKKFKLQARDLGSGVQST